MADNTPVIQPIANLKEESSVLQTINTNFTNLKSYVTNLLSTTKASENAMNVPLDMNGQRIINLPAAVFDSDVMRRLDLKNALLNLPGFLKGDTGPKGDKGEAGDTFRPNKIYNAQEIGFVCDGVTDNSAALQNIPNILPDGATIKFPVGKISISTGASWSNKSFRFEGSGPGTEIYFRPTGTTNVLFNVSLSDVLMTFQLADLSLYSNNYDSYAVNIERPSANSNVFYGPTITDVIFRGEDPNNQSWGTCMQLNNCYNFKVHRCHATGSNANFAMQFLVLTEHSTDGSVIDNRVAIADHGIWALNGAFCEGLQVLFNKFVGVRHGIFLDNGSNSPGAQIISNHINAFRYGIRCVTRPQLSIYGNLIYKFANGFDFVGIQLEAGCDQSIVQGNTILGYRLILSNDSSGIVISGTNNYMVLDNIIQECRIGLDGTNTSSGADDRNMFRNVVIPRNSFDAPNHYAGTAFIR